MLMSALLLKLCCVCSVYRASLRGRCEICAAAYILSFLLLGVTMSALLAEFRRVYRAIWRGRCVAVNVVQLPADSTLRCCP
jgi:hypothetical protein